MVVIYAGPYFLVMYKSWSKQQFALWRACYLTSSTTQFHWSSGPPVGFPSWRTWVQSPGGYLCETGILLLVLVCYIGDPDVTGHCGLVWGKLHPVPSLGRRTDNVIIPLDLTQLSCPGFKLAAGPPSGFTTDIVGCWGEPCGRAYNLTASTTQFHWSSGPPVWFPSLGTWVQSPGGTYVKPGYSC